jgi:AraC family transcriptional regulator, transcriptional activator of pobA
MSTPIAHDDFYLTEYELTSAFDRTRVEHDFHFFDFSPETDKGLAREDKQPHRHEYQEIIWVKSGPASHLLDGDWVEIQPRTLLIVPRGRVHWFRPSATVEAGVARFKDNFLPTTSSILFSQFVGLSHITVSQQELAVIESLFAVIKEEYQRFDERCCNTLKFVLLALIAKIEELKWRALEQLHPSFNNRQKFWEEFNALVEQDFRSKHTVGFYAQKLGLSPRKMNELVRPILGKTAAEVIDARRILEAKRLILFSNLSIKEIAFELGYEEHSYFTKVFKKLTGSTPSEFKHNNLSP